MSPTMNAVSMSPRAAALVASAESPTVVLPVCTVARLGNARLGSPKWAHSTIRALGP